MMNPMRTLLVVSSGGHVFNTLVLSTNVGAPAGSNGGLAISVGGFASGTIVSSGGAVLERGGLDSGSVISFGGVENVSSGTSLSAVVLSGGTSPVASAAWKVMAEGWNAPDLYSPTSVVWGS